MTEARRRAERAVAEIRATAPELLQVDGIDLGPALEQHFFLRLSEITAAPRPHWTSRVTGGSRGLASVAFAIARWAQGGDGRRTQGSLQRGSGIVIAHAPVHSQIWAPVARTLAERGYAPLVVVGGGNPRGPGNPTSDVRLFAFLGIERGRHLLARQVRQIGWLRTMAGAASRDPHGEGSLVASAGPALTRLAIQSQQLGALIEATQPSLVIAFSELSEWARLLAAVGRAKHVPTLDLPHAEASNPETLVGLDYNRMAVFGPRAADVAHAAGIPRERVVEIGAPHFDALIHRPRRQPVEPRRIVFASQHAVGLMTASVKAETLRSAVAAAEAVSPSELVVKLHPLEGGRAADHLPPSPPPPGVTFRAVAGGSLADLLDGAWLLATGWSNSVFEATIMGIPALTINVTGRNEPMGFAAEGMSVGATGGASAAAAARQLLDREWRDEVVARAGGLLERHLGPLDGRASERAADLIIEMAGDSLPRLE